MTRTDAIEVREADWSDARQAESFLALMDAFAVHPMGGGGRRMPEDARARLVDALRVRPGVHVLLAFDGSEVVGFATCIETFSTFAARPVLNLHDLMVVDGRAGAGIGRRLLEAVEALGRRIGACKLTLEVLTRNDRALAVYRAFGFAGYEPGAAHGHTVFIHKPLTSEPVSADQEPYGDEG